jgi:hypothetical protein
VAQKISKTLEKKYLFPNHPQLYLKIKLRRLILFVRKLLIKLLPAENFVDLPINPEFNNEFFKNTTNFKKKHWIFIDKFWNEEFYQLLLKQWPKNRYFETVKSITKSYDVGFLYSGKEKELEYLNRFPAYTKAFNFLKSEDACEAIKKISGSTCNYKCEHIVMTRAYWGSSVIPHIDSSNVAGNINMILFINASKKTNSGNLGIWKDNEFKENIFKPKNLKNSCLMYDMSEDFYHGFEPMDFGAYRWAIGVKYTPINLA